MARAVSGIAGAAHRSLAIIACVTPETPLIDTTIVRTIERQTAMLQFIDSINGIAGENLGGRLIHQVITALDGIIHMPLPVVLFLVAQRGCDSTLRRARVRARRVHLGQYCDAGVGQLHGRHQASAARTNNDDIEFMVHSLSSFVSGR